MQIFLKVSPAQFEAALAVREEWQTLQLLSSSWGFSLMKSLPLPGLHSPAPPPLSRSMNSSEVWTVWTLLLEEIQILLYMADK